ncbi:Band 7 domain-containing protein [Gammaproteobacteria bacterium]
MTFEWMGALGFLLALGLSNLAGIGSIETGHVGVQKRFGVVSMAAITPGLYMAPLASVKEFSAKEIAVDINGMTPKASDNLFIRELDLTVYYRVSADWIPAIETKYAGQSVSMQGAVWAPAYTLVATLARNAAYQEVSKLPSLVVHQQREQIANHIQTLLQHELDANDPHAFAITRVVIRTVITDPAIEASIQQAVANQKRLEAMELQVKIAEQEAQVRLREAQGIARSNEAINNTLTPAYLQHEANQALMEFAKKGGTATVVIPSSMNAAPLINIPAAK